MQTRTCSRCGIEKPLTEFYKHPPGWVKDGCKSRCIPCISLCNKEYNDAHLDYRREHGRAYMEELRYQIRVKVRLYLYAHPCVDCGETDPDILEFDHVRGEKRLTINGGRCANWKRIETELTKCDVRCVSCHRRKTIRDANAPWRLRFALEYPEFANRRV